MTGYSRIVCQTRGAPLTVAIRSVNRRGLEISCHLPPFLNPYEATLKGWIGEEVQRGSLHLQIDWPLPQEATPNLPLLKRLKEGADGVAQVTGLPFPEAFKLVSRGHEGELMSRGEAPIDQEVLERGVREALKGLMAMREREGATILEELKGRCQAIERWVLAAEGRVAEAPNRIRERLSERLKEWELDGERMGREVALLAEKASAAEELSRLRYHLKALRARLEGGEPVSGKTCEFMVQEMGREANTLGAKAQDAQTSEIVVEIKGELEKMKEQLANVE